MLGLLGLIILAVVIGAILGFVAFGRTRTLVSELAALRLEIKSLRAQLEVGGGTARPAAAPPPVQPMPASEAEPVEPAEPAVPATPAEPAEPAVPAEPAEEPVPPEAPEPTEPSEEPSEEPAQEPAAASAEPPRVAARASFEEVAGTRWAVWVGGVALALGAIFLVRYSIEAGLLGPGARVTSGVILALVLLAAGEWMRRRMPEARSASEQRAYIPGVLTAAGTIAAFASTYAAYGLYGLLHAAPAFILLGFIGLVTMAAALLHGPILAGLGLAASYATPLLVASREPALGPLVLYLLVVGIAAALVARARLWRWLGVVAAIGAILWALFMLVFAGRGETLLIAFYLLASFAITHGAFVWTIHERDPGLAGVKADRLAMGLVAGFAVPAFFLLSFGQYDNLVLGVMIVTALALIVTASEWPALRGSAVAGAVLVVLGYVAWKGNLIDILEATNRGLSFIDSSFALAQPETARFLGTGMLLGLLFLVAGVLGTLRSVTRAELAAVGAAVPIGVLAGAYLRVAQFETSFGFGVLALGLAALLAALTEVMIRRLPAEAPGVDGAIAAYAVGAIAALAGALTIMLDRGWLTIALALICPAIAWVETWRPVKGLRATAVVAAAVVIARFIWDPAVVGDDVGTTPVFNWLLYGYGVPAIAFAGTAELFRRTGSDRVVQLFEGLAIFFALTTAVMVIHHAMVGGDLRKPISGLTEQSLYTLVMLSAAVALQRIERFRPSLVFLYGSMAVGAIGMVMIVLGHIFAFNPYFTGENIGLAPISAKLAFGYLAPALLAAVVSVMAGRADRPQLYVQAAGWLAALMAAAWVTLQVRAFYHRPVIAFGRVTEAELYTYSVVWLVCGLAVLGAGLAFASRTLRLASGAIVMLVVIKVFLVDMAGLTGILRALSFIGLGLVLILVGLIYQRLLTRAGGEETGGPPASG